MAGRPDEVSDKQAGCEPDAEKSSSDRLYTPTQIRVGAVLGGWLAGYWMLRANYEVLANQERSRRLIWWAVGTTIAFFLLSPCLAAAAVAAGDHVSVTADGIGQSSPESEGLLLTVLIVLSPLPLWFVLAVPVAIQTGAFASRFDGEAGVPSASTHSNFRVILVCIVALGALVAITGSVLVCSFCLLMVVIFLLTVTGEITWPV